jgi:hypothetical protein
MSDHALNRRRFLKRSLIGAGAFAACPAGAAGWSKMTKKQAGYIERKKSAAQMCVQCLYFIDPNDCVIVQGPVSPKGWCTYYGD